MSHLDTARAVAERAADLLAGAAGRAQHVRTKTTFKDLVTEWDTRVEELIARELRARTPDIPLLAEESARDDELAAGAPPLRWVVDPIDGTVNFAHGLPLFSVCISLEERGDPVCGVVRAPAMGWELYAERGAGAYDGGDRLRVSATAELAQALLATGFPYDRATSDDANFREWEHFQRRAGACRRLGCASLDLCMVARGWLDGYWEKKLQPWDLSAGALIVAEAGGRVTALDGGPFRSASGEACASNGLIHDAMLAELRAVTGLTPRSPGP